MKILKTVSNCFAGIMLFMAFGILNYGDMQIDAGNYSFDQTANILQAIYCILAASPSLFIWLKGGKQ